MAILRGEPQALETLTPKEVRAKFKTAVRNNQPTMALTYLEMIIDDLDDRLGVDEPAPASSSAPPETTVDETVAKKTTAKKATRKKTAAAAAKVTDPVDPSDVDTDN